MAGNQPRIVVRRKRVYAESESHGSWKIAYADFVTAMMAFFLVMWLLSLVPPKDLKIIADYFRTPLRAAVLGDVANEESGSIIPGGMPSVIPNVYPIPSRADVITEGDLIDYQRLENLRSNIEDLIESDPLLKPFRPQLLLDMTPDGLRVQIIDKNNRPMFAVGSALVQSYMQTILRELAPVFNELPNRLTISGHTDALRYATGDRHYSNWELSADRANAARRELMAGGLDEVKVMRVLGLADSVSLIKDDPLAAVNRRISILVLNQRAERRIHEQDMAGSTDANLQQLLEPAPEYKLSIPGLPVQPGAPADLVGPNTR